MLTFASPITFLQGASGMRLSRDGNKLPPVLGRTESRATRTKSLLFPLQADRPLVGGVQVVPAMVHNRPRSKKTKPKLLRRSKLAKLSRSGRRTPTTQTMRML
jgi:hypothetical protein